MSRELLELVLRIVGLLHGNDDISKEEAEAKVLAILEPNYDRWMRLLLAASEREKELEAFVENISKQRPEKPDYWSSCGQCENNTDDAKELLAKSATPPVSEETR